jgi:glycosyltransferase involved in cell wall biosynthesis
MNALSITRRRVRRRAKRALETIGLQVTHVDSRYVQPSYNDQTPLPPGARDLITFLGPVDHEVLKGAFEACQAFVFPTLQDFVGRVAVEALTAGTPLVVSPMTGAVGTIVPDGVNGIVVDPRDPRALARAMHRLADPETSRTLREGVRQTNSALHPDAAADVVLSAVAGVGSAPRGNGSKRRAEVITAHKTGVQHAD